MAMLRHSPYHHRFTQLGAQFVERIGFAAPAVFSTTEDEHRATRERVGLFDVYYQVPIEIAGAEAAAVLDAVLVADVSHLPVGRVVYAAPCNARGGMIDDLTCYRLDTDRFWLVPTPSRVEAVLATVQRAASGRHAVVTPLGYKNAYLSVQGPASRELLQGLTDADLSGSAMAYFSLKMMTLADVPMLVSRTGYSGELGYELFYPSEYAEHVLDTLLEAGRPLGVLPCGLGALRSLRIEKRYPLYGLDLDESTTPIEAGLGWTVKLSKLVFQGRDVLEQQKQNGTDRQLVLLMLAEDAPPPIVGATIGHGGVAVGRVTSADRGHTVGRTLAMGYVPPSLALDGQALSITGDEGGLPAVVSVRAAYDPEGKRVRG